MFHFNRSALAALALALGLGGAALQGVSAAGIPISNNPVVGNGQATPKPNIMLLMDTSKSMSFTHMPDEAETTAYYTQSIGYRSAQCNSLYYNPNTQYTVPVNAAQQAQPTPSFNNARYDFYSTTNTATVNLASQFRAYDVNTLAVAVAGLREDPPQAAYYYVYTGTTPLNYATAPCTDQDAVIFPGADYSAPRNTVGGTWTRKLVTSTSGTGPAGADERTNFAIWYTYYRTRMALMKSSVSTAFAPMTEKYRVGFVSVNPLVDTTNASSGVDSAKYLAIEDFAPTHKTAWFNKVFAQQPLGSSPAREGLARVGRHFGGKSDGINTNMVPDPNLGPGGVINSCQQNFTIMTTDGYWNTAAETVGPVKLDGTTKVGNQDGTLTPENALTRDNPAQYTHRPMYDGVTTGTRTDRNRMEQKRYAACDSGQFYKTTTILRATTSQTLQRTQGLTRSTAQISQSTTQTSLSTAQEKQRTQTATRQSLQAFASTQQQTKSTRQELRRTISYGQGSAIIYQRTTQVLQTSSYMERRQTQRQIQTTRTLQTVSRLLQSTNQMTASTLQYKVSTSQLLKSTATYFRTVATAYASTTQNLQSTRREFERTSQLVAYDGATEQAVPVGSCTGGGTVTCLTLTAGPTAVASCTPQTPGPGNNYLGRTCDAPQLTGPTPVQTCTPASPTSANGFTTTTCSVATTGPTAQACTPTAAALNNNWTATTCSTSTAAEVQTASCTPSVSGALTTTCRTQVLTTDVPSQTCAAGTSGTTATTCRTAVTGPTPVASCSTSGASGSNNWTATTCTPTSTGPTGVQSCTPSGPTLANSYVQTTCNPVTTTQVRVASCTASAATSGNQWKETICEADTGVASATYVDSCTAQNAGSTNNFIKITCQTTSSTWANASSCTPSGPTSNNGNTTTTCRDNPVGSPTAVQPASCVAGTSGSGLTTICTPIVQTDVPTSACTPNTTGPTYVSCRTVTTGPTAVSSCTPGGGANTNWVISTCTTVSTPVVNVPSCTPQTADPSNGNVTITCTPNIQTVGVQPGTCVPQTGSLLNNWVTIECPAPILTGPTPVLLGSCSPVPATLANGWNATTCDTIGPTAPTAVQTCTPGVNPSTFVVTTCTNSNTTVDPVVPGTCVPVTATAANQWRSTVCGGTDTTINVAAGSCVPSAANALTQVTCATVRTGPTFVAPGSCSPGTDNNFKVTTCNTVNTGPTLVGACTPGTDANFLQTTCNTVTTGPTQLPLGTACSNIPASSNNNWTSTTCSSTDVEVGVPAGSCVPSAPGVLPTVTCRTVNTPATPVATCSAQTDANFVTTVCTPEVVGPELTTSCTPVAPTLSNGFTAVTCSAIAGTKIQVKIREQDSTYKVSGNTPILTSRVDGPEVITDWADIPGGQCYAPPAVPPVIDTSPVYRQSTTGMPGTCTAWPCTIAFDPSTATGGSSNSLADVAQYYYVTDLRPSTGADPDPWANNVAAVGTGIESDRAPWQHMTTFVLGLGVSGTLDYKTDYVNGTGDFAKIRSYTNTPPVNWPVWPTAEPMPSPTDYNDPRSIDDFWHTAVNGRGRYFSANDPATVVKSLQDALTGIDLSVAAGAGAATSSLNPVAGDNAAFVGSFTANEWTGDLTSKDIDLSTSNISSTVRWSAAALLNSPAFTGAACDNRRIFVRDPSNNSLVNFSWNSQGCTSAGLPNGTTSSELPTSLRAYFNATVVSNGTTGLSQYGSMNAPQQAAVSGANLVNFLRGQRGFEGFVANDPNKLYRSRKSVLGDIVGSQPLYVKAPSLGYQDTGYDNFKTTNSGRTPMVYVGANDGMLHAFYAPQSDTDPNLAKAGQEAWAFVPSPVVKNLYKLADQNYGSKHIFTVDGPPVAGDVFDTAANAWKTILVGGLGAGGKGYYALDVTNAGNVATPRILWEFTAATACAGNPVGATSDCNLGLTFGRPVITKLKSGKWVVMVTSGYNNDDQNGGAGDGKGYLYVLDAISGAIISRIGTGAGTVADPSGLRELNYFVSDLAYDNTALRAYGGDIQGNIWRFDINDTIEPAGLEANLIGTAIAGGKRQPIVTRPELAEVNGSTMVLVGTGKLLTEADLTDTSVQSIYGIIDPMGAASPTYADLRGSLKPLALTQTGTGSAATRTVACTGASTLDCSGTNGWYIDLPEAGERANIDIQAVLGTLVFATNVPSDALCVAGGHSWLNYVNLATGEAVGASEGGTVSVPFFQNAVTVGMSLIGIGGNTPGSTPRIGALGTASDVSNVIKNIPIDPPAPEGKRITWREVTQ